MSNEDFFAISREQSRVKAAIVSEYFWSWAKVILSTVRTKPNGRIAYIDLFAGPGRYEDGTKSTPLLVLQQAIADEDMRKYLVTLFNDTNGDNTRELEVAIRKLDGLEKLKYQPEIYNNEVGDKIVEMFEDMSLIPTLFFVDPWGYKGLSLRLINSVLRNWGCDCIFFFNYNRINMGLGNEFVEHHMDALFGKERANNLRQKLANIRPQDREATIVEEIAQALKEMGGKFVLPFRFKNDKGTRTSHHLIFVTKHFRGYDIMKGIMAKQSSSSEEGVSSFEYSPATSQQPLLFELFRPRPINDLKNSLLQTFSRKTLSMEHIYEQHSVDTPYVSKNYKEALRQLEAEGLIITNPPPSKRKVVKGEVTFADSVEVTFK